MFCEFEGHYLDLTKIVLVTRIEMKAALSGENYFSFTVCIDGAPKLVFDTGIDEKMDVLEEKRNQLIELMSLDGKDEV